LIFGAASALDGGETAQMLPKRARSGLLAISIPFFVAAQSPSSRTDANQEMWRPLTNIRVHSDLVVIPVTVTDSKGRAVTGLQKQHFELYEDKVRQTITQFDTEDAPVSVGLLVDASDSMEPRMNQARAAVAELLERANPQDEFFLIRFSTRAELVAGFTADREELRSAMQGIGTGGSTALLDAVLLAIGEMKQAHYNRKALIIISDGEDNSSRVTESRFRALVSQSDVLIYAIGICDSNSLAPGAWSGRLSGSALLHEIATQTGGHLFQVNKLKQLPEVASTIGSWLRNQYVLGYAPANEERNGKYRRIQVKLSRPKGFPKLHASWRLGYYAPSE
jgi:Ca-activated chloride channel family protein